MSRLTHWKDPDAQPTLSHDIEEWIKDHSHAGLWDRTVDQGRAIDQLEDRVAVLENGLFNALTRRVARLEETIEWMRDGHFCEPLPQEPRGPHD